MPSAAAAGAAAEPTGRWEAAGVAAVPVSRWERAANAAAVPVQGDAPAARAGRREGAARSDDSVHATEDGARASDGGVRGPHATDGPAGAGASSAAWHDSLARVEEEVAAYRAELERSGLPRPAVAASAAARRAQLLADVAARGAGRERASKRARSPDRRAGR